MLKDDRGIIALPLAFGVGQGVKLAILAVVLVVRIRDIRPDGTLGPGARPDDTPTSTMPAMSLNPPGAPAAPSS